MCFTPDSYSAIILCKFPAFFAYTYGLRNLVAEVEDIWRRVSHFILFMAVQSPTAPLLPPPIQKNSISIVFIVQSEKKPMAFLHLFSRPELETGWDCKMRNHTNNISTLRDAE